jgi:hypothetical protein
MFDSVDRVVDRKDLIGPSCRRGQDQQRSYTATASGSFRVKVYAGTDPVTGKARLLRQTCPDEAAAHAALGRMLVAESAGGRDQRK